MPLAQWSWTLASTCGHAVWRTVWAQVPCPLPGPDAAWARSRACRDPVPGPDAATSGWLVPGHVAAARCAARPMGPPSGRVRHARGGRRPVAGFPHEAGPLRSQAGGSPEGRPFQRAHAPCPHARESWPVPGSAPPPGHRRRRPGCGPWCRGPLGANPPSRHALAAAGCSGRLAVRGGGARRRGGAAGHGGVRRAVRAVGCPWRAVGQRTAGGAGGGTRSSYGP